MYPAQEIVAPSGRYHISFYRDVSMINQDKEMYDIPLLVQRAQAFADATRMRILLLFLEGETTVSDLVTRLGVPQPRVSTHLAFLRNVGLVSVDHLGRQRRYRPDVARIEAVLEALRALPPTTPRRSPQARRESHGNTAIRQARTCYDHLAGVAGVQLLGEMLQRGWLEPDAQAEQSRPLYRLTLLGTQALRARGVDVTRAEKARRRLAFGCIDWTERRRHLGGALGAAILEALLTAGIVRRRRQSRTVVCQQPVMEWFDVVPSGQTDMLDKNR
jgi:DNA-binding transcriptional ArsR family regulator